MAGLVSGADQVQLPPIRVAVQVEPRLCSTGGCCMIAWHPALSRCTNENSTISRGGVMHGQELLVGLQVVQHLFGFPFVAFFKRLDVMGVLFRFVHFPAHVLLIYQKRYIPNET